MRDNDQGIIIDRHGTRKVGHVTVSDTEWRRAQARLSAETTARSHAPFLTRLLTAIRAVRKTDRERIKHGE